MDRKETLGLLACGVMLVINLGIFAVTVVTALLDEPSPRAPVAVFGPDTADRATLDAMFDNDTLVASPREESNLMISQDAAEGTP